MADEGRRGADGMVLAAHAAAEALFGGATARDQDGVFPHEAVALLHEAGLMRAPFPADLGGNDLAAPGAVDRLRDVLRSIGGGDLAVGRLYEGHVNAVALVARHGTSSQLAALAADVRGGAMSGVWNAEGSRPVTLSRDGGAWRLSGAKILCSGAGSLTRPLIPVTHGGSILMVMPTLAPGERADLSSWTPQGMRASATGTMDLTGLRIQPEDIVGSDDDYRRQPAFFGGAWRFCAVQLGAVGRLVDLFRAQLVRTGRDGDPCQRLRIAACASAAETASLWVREASRLVATEALPSDDILAYVGLTRGIVERAALDVMEAVHKGLGLGSFMRPHPVERVARDLATYLRQPSPDAATLDAAARVLASPAPVHSLWHSA